MNNKVQGSSAGLAFCLQMVAAVSDGMEVGAIAATGMLSDATGEAAVVQVEGINNKLAAALEVLASGDRVFYPLANSAEVGSELQQRAEDKGIALLPVATVAEAIAELLSPAMDEKDPEPASAEELQDAYADGSLSIWAFAAAGIALIAGGLFYLARQPVPPAADFIAQVVSDMEQGRYTGAGVQMESFLKNTSDAEVEYLQHQLRDELQLAINFHYRADGKEGQVTLGGPAEEVALGFKDLYRLSQMVSDSCYLYVFQVDAQGQVDRLPRSDPAAAPFFFRGGAPAWLPPRQGDWFRLDDSVGRETLYFAASRRPSRDLEAAYRALVEAPAAEKQRRRDALIEQLQDRERARAMGIGGVFFQRFDFKHE